MARPGLTSHRKFRRLAKQLGSPILARGVLELMWESCYESGDDYVGTGEDIEQLIGWKGEPGVVALALVAAGLPEGHGFIEPLPSETGGGSLCYRVHDLWHHAPDYVAKRHKREMERRQRVVPVPVDRRTAPNGGQWTPSPDCQTGVDRTPSPSPSPSPSPAPIEEQPTEPVAALLVFPATGKGPKEWTLTEAQASEWQADYPGLDILGECRKALAWVRANQPKTARGTPAFLVNWFNRSANRGGSQLVAVPRSRPGPSHAPWECPHVESCSHRAMCDHKLNMPAKYPVRQVEAV
jgi:hypothetical protein